VLHAIGISGEATCVGLFATAGSGAAAALRFASCYFLPATNRLALFGCLPQPRRTVKPVITALLYRVPVVLTCPADDYGGLAGLPLRCYRTVSFTTITWLQPSAHTTFLQHSTNMRALSLFRRRAWCAGHRADGTERWLRTPTTLAARSLRTFAVGRKGGTDRNGLLLVGGGAIALDGSGVLPGVGLALLPYVLCWPSPAYPHCLQPMRCACLQKRTTNSACVYTRLPRGGRRPFLLCSTVGRFLTVPLFAIDSLLSPPLPVCARLPLPAVYRPMAAGFRGTTLTGHGTGRLVGHSTP